MPNELVNTPETPATSVPEPADTGPTREEILSALAAERAQKEALIYENQSLRVRPQAPPMPQSDPLERYEKEGITLPDSERRQLLDEAITRRAEAAAVRAAQIGEQRARSREIAAQNQAALDAVVLANPDLADPKNQPKFAAAVVEADMEARAAGVTYSPMQLAQKAAAKFRAAQNPPAAPQTPYVEGAGRPGASPTGSPVETEPQQNFAEELYGFPAGTIKPLTNVEKQMEEETRDYVRRNNAAMFEKGVRSNMAEVNRTLAK